MGCKTGPKPRNGQTAHIKVGCRLNETELERLRRLVKNSGVSMAEYIRAKIFRRKPVVSLGEPVEDE